MNMKTLQTNTKRAICILFAFIFTISGIFVLKSNTSASADDLSVNIKTDKSSYSYSENVTVYVTVSNSSDIYSYKNITVSPASSQYYSSNKTTHENIEEIKPGCSKTVGFTMKLSENASDLNILQKIILFFRNLFSGKTPLGGNYNGKYKKTTSLEISQQGSKKVNFTIYYYDPIIESYTYTTSPAVRSYKFRNKDLLNQHYQKHGIEMGFSSAELYEYAASQVAVNPSALHKIEKEDGDDVYYIVATNEFVVISTDGYIRTYFKPDSGKAYFDKQWIYK